MTEDENDFVYVERLVSQPRRRTRRHVTVADSDWRPIRNKVGECKELRSMITINGVAFDLVMVEVVGDKACDVRVAGRRYRVAGLMSVSTA